MFDLVLSAALMFPTSQQNEIAEVYIVGQDGYIDGQIDYEYMDYVREKAKTIFLAQCKDPVNYQAIKDAVYSTVPYEKFAQFPNVFNDIETDLNTFMLIGKCE